MRYFIALFLLSISTFSSGQTELLDAKKLWARDSIRLGTNWIRSISKDTALLTVTDRDIPSAKAVKDFVLNRWNNGLLPWDNVTSKPSLLISGNNLADVSNVATARTNLSVYSIATVNDSLLNHFTKSQADARFKSIDWFPSVANVTGLPDSLTNLQARIQTKLTKTDADTYYPAIQRMQDSLAAVQARVQTKEPFISSGTTSQYWRGDKAWQTLDKSAVGLSAVPNVDATNPVNISQSATYRFVTDSEKSTWNAKQNALGYTAENAANKATDFSTVNNTLYPTVQAVSNAISTATSSYIPLSQKGANNGVATLDVGGKVPFSQLPAALMIYKGTWNVSTNTPTLSDGTGVSGWVYIVSVGGTVNTGSGNITYSAGDYAIHNGSTWEKSAGTNNVASVNGQQGVVNLTTANISESGNLYYTDARARAALSFTQGSGAYNSSTGVITIPTNTNQLTNGAGFITGYTETDPTIYAWAKAATKPSYSYGEITGTPTTWAWGSITGIPSTFAPSAHSHGNADITDLAWAKITGAPAFITGINSGMVTTALGYTPYNSTNPSGYITSASLSGYLPLSGGTLTGGLSGTTADFSGLISGGGTIRATGATGGLVSGSGVEIRNNSGTGEVFTYNRATAAYLPTRIDGSTLALNTLTSGAITLGGALNGTTASFIGNINQGGGTASNTAGFTNNLYLESSIPSLTLSNTGAGTGKYTLGVTGTKFGLWNNTTSTYEIFIDPSGSGLTEFTRGISSTSLSISGAGSFGGELTSKGSTSNWGFRVFKGGTNTTIGGIYQNVSGDGEFALYNTSASTTFNVTGDGTTLIAGATTDVNNKLIVNGGVKATTGNFSGTGTFNGTQISADGNGGYVQRYSSVTGFYDPIYLYGGSGGGFAKFLKLNNTTLETDAALIGTNAAFTLNQNATSLVTMTNTDATNANSRAGFRATSNTVQSAFLSINGAGSFIGSETNHPLDLITNGTSRVQVTTSGTVLMGNTLPSDDGLHKLIVNGDIKSDLFVKGSYISGNSGSPAYQDIISYGAPTFKSYIQGGNEYNSNTGSFLRFVVNGIGGPNNPVYALTLASSGSATFNSSATASGFIRSGSSDSYFLLGGGGHVLASTYATAASLSGYVDQSTNQYEIGGNKSFLGAVEVLSIKTTGGPGTPGVIKFGAKTNDTVFTGGSAYSIPVNIDGTTYYIRLWAGIN